MTKKSPMRTIVTIGIVVAAFAGLKMYNKNKAGANVKEQMLEIV